jgi:dTDP-4-amino-4,6-dideoxygalactose transaminase
VKKKNCIGGFFPLDIPFKYNANNFFSYLDINPTNSLFFHNARSALKYLIISKKLKTIWLPAYICKEVAEVIRTTKCVVKYYPIKDCSPDIKFLKKHMQQGESALAINYFGRLPAKDFLEFVKDRRNITWIEDRAHCLLPSEQIWGDYVIYSPRKMFGVPDGGIIQGKLSEINFLELNSDRYIEASLSRFEDYYELNNDEWYSKYKAYEDLMPVGNYKMSRISLSILSSLNMKKIIEKRILNYKHLYKELNGCSLLEEANENFVPFGFIIKTQERNRLLKHLHNNKIFASTHWQELPVDKKDFPSEYKLSQELITIPCDQRYNSFDMKFIVKTVKGII